LAAVVHVNHWGMVSVTRYCRFWAVPHAWMCAIAA